MQFYVSNPTNVFHCQFFPYVSGDISDMKLDDDPMLHSWESMETICLTADEYQEISLSPKGIRSTSWLKNNFHSDHVTLSL